jgi:hypothetical protein
LKVKIHILFYGENSLTVALRQIKFGIVKDYGHASKLFSALFSLMNVVNMAMVQSSEVMLAQMLNHCVQFYNFVQCHTFVNYLMC